MNLRQPYEQLIAHKLRKLPTPDADASWQQMKRLLDEDEDTRAGGKRSPRGGGWWRIGIIAIILSAGGWLYVKNTTKPGNAIAKNKTIVHNNNQSSTIDKNTTLPVSNSNTEDGKDNKINVAATPAPIPAAGGIDNNSATGSSINERTKDIATANTALDAASEDNNKQGREKLNNDRQVMANTTIANNAEKGKRIRDFNAPGNNEEPANAVTLKNYRGSHHSTAYIDNNSTVKLKPGGNRRHNNDKTWPAGKLSTAGNEDIANEPGYSPLQQSNAATTDWFATLSDLKKNGTIPSPNIALSVGDSIESSRNTATLLNNETKKGIAKAQRDKDLEDMTRKEHKLFHLDLSNAFKPFSLHMDAEPRWAAGIALNNGITLGAQNRFNYSMNAKSGVLTDYIPSLYLQFHLNDYVFAQTELNFVSPQYTPQLLVFQQNNDVTAQPGISQQKSVFIQKLYYFSVLVSLHYSPINNLYFSAGLQFSSFQSGLATIQEKQYTTTAGPDHPNSTSNTVLKFKDDSIAAKLAPNEWRWQAGAEYYFNRFTIGMRYNKSFKNLVTADAAASVPSAAGLRNQSMILFMRYNLFESRKKGEGQKN